MLSFSYLLTHTVWKLLRFGLTHFCQKFREINVITKALIRRKNSEREFCCFPHRTVRKIILLSLEKYFVKTTYCAV